MHAGRSERAAGTHYCGLTRQKGACSPQSGRRTAVFGRSAVLGRESGRRRGRVGRGPPPTPTLKSRLIQQVDSPINLYDKPVNKFVAGFMGSPAMNFLVGNVQNGHLKSPQFDLAPSGELAQKLKVAEGKKVYVGIRPENLGLRGMTAVEEGHNIIKAQVEVVEPLGAETHILASVGGDQTLVARVDSHAQVTAGDQIELLADLGFLHAFDMESEANLRFS